MSLGHLQAIPVDTHVFQIASSQYLKHLKDKKSVTDKVYNEIGDHFRELFGPYAGWAHTVWFLVSPIIITLLLILAHFKIVIFASFPIEDY